MFVLCCVVVGYVAFLLVSVVLLFWLVYGGWLWLCGWLCGFLFGWCCFVVLDWYVFVACCGLCIGVGYVAFFLVGVVLLYWIDMCL